MPATTLRPSARQPFLTVGEPVGAFAVIATSPEAVSSRFDPDASAGSRMRLRTVATRDRPCADFPYKNGEEYDPAVLLDLDYWVLIPR
jgi:2-methylfumaryl-CoA hydratase